MIKRPKIHAIALLIVASFMHTQVMSNTLSQLQQDCSPTGSRMQGIINQNAAEAGMMVNNDQALQELAQKPVNTGKVKDEFGNELNFDCFAQTNDTYQNAIQGLVDSVESIFEGLDFLNDIFALFGTNARDLTANLAEDASKGACSATRKAISQTIGFKCPNISVPYMSGNLGCRGGIAVRPDGIEYLGRINTPLGNARTSGTIGGNAYSPANTNATNTTVAPMQQPPSAQTSIMQRMSCAFNPANCK